MIYMLSNNYSYKKVHPTHRSELQKSAKENNIFHM